MRTVNIARLKNNLSRYLDRVRRGEEILVCDRKVPIAKIVPLSECDDLDAEERALVAAGLMRPAKFRPTPEFWKRFWSVRGLPISEERAVAAVIADREED